MSKLFTEVNGRFYDNQKFRKFTIDCNKIEYYGELPNGHTDVHFKEGVIIVDMPYYEFQQNVMGEILKVEHQNDVLKLMAGYLSNNVITSISPEVLIKDCEGIIKKISSENNTL
jgi:hypothetical protein